MCILLIQSTLYSSCCWNKKDDNDIVLKATQCCFSESMVGGKMVVAVLSYVIFFNKVRNEMMMLYIGDDYGDYKERGNPQWISNQLWSIPPWAYAPMTTIIICLDRQFVQNVRREHNLKSSDRKRRKSEREIGKEKSIDM